MGVGVGVGVGVDVGVGVGVGVGYTMATVERAMVLNKAVKSVTGVCFRRIAVAKGPELHTKERKKHRINA